MNKAITVKHPWASFLFKKATRSDILTMAESTDHRGPLVIVSDVLIDEAAISTGDLDIKDMAFGRSLGVRYLIDCRPMVKEDEYKAKKFYMKGLFSWVFDDRVEIFGENTQVMEFAKSGVVYDILLPNGMVVVPLGTRKY